MNPTETDRRRVKSAHVGGRAEWMWRRRQRREEREKGETGTRRRTETVIQPSLRLLEYAISDIIKHYHVRNRGVHFHPS